MNERRGRLVTRHPRLARLGVAAAVAVAFAGLIVHGDLAGHRDANGGAATAAAIAHDRGAGAALAPRPLHSQPLSRTRGFGFALLAAAIVGAAYPRRTVHVRRSVGACLHRVLGLPPGRAPPLARIA